MDKIVTFGEMMLRLSPTGYNRFLQTNSFDAMYGGGEANVAVSLSNFGKNAYYVTKLPNHEIGQCAVNELRKYGVKTDYIVRGGDRIGVYFCERGASQRPSKVIYDRANSAISLAKRDEFNWSEIFKDANWFHISGITAGISETAPELCLDSLKAAKESNVTISFDVNFRSKLWPIEKASKVFNEMVKYCDVLIGSEKDAKYIFNIEFDERYITDGNLTEDGYKDIMRKLANKYNIKYIAFTQRDNLSASDNTYTARLYNKYEDTLYKSKKYNMHIVDRVGGGDAFTTGLIYGLTSNMSNQDIIEFATASSVLKHSIEGDYNISSVDEVMLLTQGDGSGAVQR